MNKTVYLSGAIGSLSYEDAIAWRMRATKMLGLAEIDTLDPMRGHEYLASVETIPALATEDTVGHLALPKVMVERDKRDIKLADAVLVELTNPTHLYRGTLMEFMFAYEREKPIVVWSSWAKESPWLAYHATVVHETLEDCVDAIKELLL